MHVFFFVWGLKVFGPHNIDVQLPGYVAATGLPTPQNDHPVRMVRFARDCMYKLGIVLSDLVDRLGEDTVELRMRVGIHSGPTTGGVLRGKKGRFQLFGDTVNTASRMESTGMPGRVHISQTTADALKARGKSAWFTPRDDQVEAKGKGFLQTYWVNAEVAQSATTRHSTTDYSSSPDNFPMKLGSLDEHGEDEMPEDEEASAGAGSMCEELELEKQLNGYLARGERGNSSGNTYES